MHKISKSLHLHYVMCKFDHRFPFPPKITCCTCTSTAIFGQGVICKSKKYTHLAFDKYINTQKAMDCIVNNLVNCKQRDGDDGRPNRVLGGTEFNTNSPIIKYRRCPATRKLCRNIKRFNN